MSIDSLRAELQAQMAQQMQQQAAYNQKVKLGTISNFSPFNPNFNDQGAYDALDAADKARLQQIADDWSQDGSRMYAAEINNLYKKGADAAQYSLKYNPVVQNPDGTIGLRQELMLSGADKYMDPLLAQQDVEEKFGRDNAVSQAQQAADMARANMAMRGGNKAGNNALTARNSLRDMLMAQQGVSQQAMKDRANIRAKGADVQMQQDNANKKTLMDSIQGVNQFNLEKYKQAKSVEAAKAQADATRAAGSGGSSWVCTEVHRRNPLTRDEAFALFKLRKFSLKNFPELAQFYLYGCSPLVDKMKERGADWGENEDFVKNTVALVKEGSLEKAFEYYVSYIFEKMKIFWPDCNHKVFTELKEMI